MNRYHIITLGCTVLVSAIFYYYFSHKKSKRLFQKEKQNRSTFFIHNHFPNHLATVEIEDPFHNKIAKKNMSVKEMSFISLSNEEVKEYMRGGNIIKIYITSKMGERKHFSDYIIDTDNSLGERIRGLHIGMITTRFIGSTDSLRMSTVSGNAVGGNAYVNIHNMSKIPLSLNGGDSSQDPTTSQGGILIPPETQQRYKGYLHQGVTLGTIFSDDDNLYPDFQYLEPHSDIYYGVVSDIEQPLYGCWQLEYTDECDYGQTLWPMQEGVL